MGEVRDPERDQPLPKPGGLPVQAILIAALQERTEYGRRKYGDVLRTNNGRRVVLDAWEEAMDLLVYLTQLLLEQDIAIPGTERVVEAERRLIQKGETAEVQHERTRLEGLAATRGRLDLAVPMACVICGHQPHIPGGCLDDAPGGRTNCQCGIEVALAAKEASTLAVCPNCLHGPHAPGGCTSAAPGLACSCLEAA